MELALWADMRVVAEDATFGIFCRRFGVPLIDLGTIRLPRLIGHSQAIDLILTGRPVGAQEALRMGLANRVVGRGEAYAQAIALAKEIARFPQKCLRADRLSALRQWDLSEEEAIANEMRGGLEVIGSGETLSGATRFASGVGRHGTFSGERGPIDAAQPCASFESPVVMKLLLSSHAASSTTNVRNFRAFFA